MKIDIKKLRIIMAENNLNQKKLALLASIQTSTLNMIINGKSNGNPDTWQKIADSLGISVKDLIED